MGSNRFVYNKKSKDGNINEIFCMKIVIKDILFYCFLIIRKEVSENETQTSEDYNRPL